MSQSSNKETREGIAVVGMSGRFPGARSLDEFWRNLRDGVESVRELSREELAAAGVDPGLLDNPRYVRAGVELEDVERFDAPFFGINPREAEVMDPQQRLFLECAWEALEDAGHDPGRFPGAVGVFASSLMSQYLLANLLPNPEVLETVGGLAVRILNDKDFLATRVSYKLNLRGPSLSVQTACSSSLVAFHLACQSLMSYECDMALVGGVSVNLPRGSGYLYTEGGIYSPDGHCRAFDANAAGTLNGSGLGVMVLRRLEDAVADGDRVRAVVLSTAVNNDGSLKVGFTAPSVEGQAEVVAAAQAFAEIDPETITYIEAHGTGTALGDPVEVAALTRVFREQTDRKGFCAIGSLKTNIGHLDAAAGVAGLIKTVLALEHRQLPPSLNCDEPNPAIGFPETPFYVNTRLSDWTTDGAPRRAGVSALGVGGTNAHVILEEAPERRQAASASRPWQVLTLSARDEGALEEMTDRLARHLRANPDLNLADAAFTLEAGRAPFALRRTVVAADPADAAEVLEARDPKRVFTASAPEEGSAEPVFLFSGQGSQYPGMGADLYRAEPVFREVVDRCAELLRTHLGLDLREVLFPTAETAEAAARRLGQTFLTQPAIFMVSYATARLWMSWGVKPKAMIGHSIGEYVAACLSGVMSPEDALSLVAARGRLLQSLPPGAMLSVPLPEAEVLPLLGTRLSLAAVNGPALCAVSGPEEAVEELAAGLSARGVEVRRLHTSHAFHSAMMNPILGAFTDLVAKVELKAPRIPYLSNLTGTWITPEEARDPRYWTRHLRETVRFSAGIEELLRQPDRVLLEVGPGQALTRIARLHRVDGRAPVALASLRHPQEETPDLRFLLTTLGRLWQAGVTIDWKAFRRGEKRRRVALPTYPFQRRTYWISPPRGEASARRRSAAGRLWAPVWREAPLPASTDSSGEVVLLSGQGDAAYGLARRLEQWGREVVVVHTPEDVGATLRRLEAEGRGPVQVVHLGDEPLEIPAAWIVSRTEEVSGEDELVPERALAAASFMGEGRRRIDVSPVRPGSAQEERLLDLLAAELLAADPAPVVAYRGTRRWLPGFEPVAIPAGAGSGEPRQGVYLLGGSPTEPSLELASLLTEAGCRVVEAPEDGLRGAIHELGEGRADADLAALRDLAELAEARSLDLVVVVSRGTDGAARFADALAHERNRTGRTHWLRLSWQSGEPLRPEDRDLLRALWAPGFPARVVVASHDPETPVLEAPAAHERPELQSAYAAPRTELERRVAAIWQDLLGIDRIGVHDDFFELGGNSLLATQALSRVRDVLRIEMPLRDLFEAPTVSELAARLEASEQARLQTLPVLARRPGSRPTELPLSAIQRRLWILDSLEPGNPAYNMLTAVRIWGDLDPAALAGSFREIVRRHDALRASFELVGEEPVQRIGTETWLDLPLVDLGALPADRRDEEGRRLAREERRFRFDLSTGPLVRTLLVRLGAREHLLLPTFHHIVFDGWSQGVLISDLAALYPAAVSGGPSPLPELPLQYADYALWQQDWLEAGGRETELAYWRGQLAGAPPFLELPTDRPRPLAQSFRGSSLPFAIPEIGDAVAALGRGEGATLFMTLLAAFDVLLSRYTGLEDVVVGTPVANRERTEMEGLIGCFLNTLALRADLSGRPTFLGLLARVRETTLEAFAHQNLPFEELVEELQPERSLGQNPVFQVALLLESARGLHAELPGLRFETLEQDSGTAKFDLTLALEERGGALVGVAEYKTDLFEAATMRRLAGHFGALLQAALDDPHRAIEDLPLLTAAERHQVAVEWNGARGPAAEETVPARFLAQAARTPEAVAVRHGETSLTYAELAWRVESLARHLRHLGVGPGDPVGLSLERSPGLVVGVLGILLSGGAYLPLDPGYPDARLELLLGDGLADRPGAVLLTESRLAERLSHLAPAGTRVVCLDTDRAAIESAQGEVEGPGADDLAYLIYTSGTTGRPKAVLVEHRQLAAVLRASEAFGFRPGDVMPCLASSSFDIFLFELLNPLLAGGTSVLVDLRPALDLERLVDLLETSTQVHSVPALMRQVVEAVRAKGRGPEQYRRYRGLRTIFVGGDAVPADLLTDLRQVFPSAEVRVLYGPTEATIICSSDRVSDSDRVSIGRALDGASLHVCDPAGQPVPVGVPGEIRIGGSGVTRGYLHRPDLTAERFVPDPFAGTPGARVYRSGDLARLLPDGRLEFLGRTDNQVKVRGFRVELGEVESALLAHPEVREAVALVRRDGGRLNPDNKQLVAFVAPQVPADLRAWLQQRLSDPMVPSAFVAVEALPLTSHGKVDRRALERMALPAARREGDFAAPRNPVEALLARIWSELLRVEEVGIHDNFFELGGDSILSIQVVSRAAREGCRITPRQMFEHQTIAALAEVAGSAAVASADQGPVRGPVELTPIQRWFFAVEPVEPHHFNQSVLLAVRGPLAPETAARAFAALLDHHDALRLRFERTADGWRQWNDGPASAVSWSRLDLSSLSAIEPVLAEVQASLDLTQGPLARGVWIDLPRGEARLLLAVHHLAVDGVSWRVLLEDLEAACRQSARGEAISLPPKTTSFQSWSRQLAEHARSMPLEPELSWWRGESEGEAVALPVDFPEGANTEGSLRSVSSVLAAEETRALLQEVPAAYRTQINDVLLAALALALAGPGRALRVALEGHGREEILPDVDLSRTVGWLTALYPVRLETGDGPGETLKGIKEHLRAVPGRGLGFGLLSWLRDDCEELRTVSPQVSFNYLGQLDQALPEDSLFAVADEPAGPMRSPRALRRYELDVVGGVTAGRLQVEWAYSENLHRRETVEALSERYLACLRDLIAHCRGAVARGIAGYTPSDFPLAGLNGETLDRALGRGIEDLYPLSPVQEGLLFHSLYAPGSGVYVDQLGVTLRGAVEPEAIERACRWLVGQHPVLRTSFLWRELERPLQAVHARVDVEIAVLDWRGLAAAEVERRAEALQREDRERGFDLSAAPLTRWTLVRLADDEHWLLWTHHHILIDGWSFAALASEFLTACEAFSQGREPVAPRRPLYRDYIAWIERQDLSGTEAYWRRTLAGWEEPTPIPIRREPAGPEAGTATAALALSAEETAELQALARRHQLTLNTLTQAAWAFLLGRYGNASDVVFGATVAGRPADLPGVDRMVGLFINTLPVRVAADGAAPLLPWLQALQLGQSELRQHEHSPLVKVQKWSGVPAGRELFDSILVFENYPREAAMQGPGGSAAVEIADVRSHEQTNYPLTVLVVPGDRLMLRLEYDRSLFEAEAADRLTGHLRNVLGSLAERLREGGAGRLEDLSLLGTAERRQLLEEWNATARSYAGPELLHEWIEAQAARTPSAEAVRFEDRSLSYDELNLRADGLARHLRTLGVGPDVLVGVCMERSLELVVSLLAVLKAGGAYVPLDPGYPAERLAFMLEDSGAPVLLTQTRLAGMLPAGAVLVDETEWAGEPLNLGIDPDSLAYMIYTSGSTGRPKGAMNTHRAIVNRLLWMQEAYGLGAGDRVLQKTPFSFDVSVWEFFWPLMTGACLVVAKPEGHRDGAYLVDLIRRERVTTLHFVPSMLRAFLEQPGVEACTSIRQVMCSGEALPHDLQERFFSRSRAELHNLYGPTEAAVDVSFWACRRDDERTLVPIGRPIANVRLHVLDNAGEPCPVGVPGELHIGGVALARGYWGRPELTADRFIPDPFAEGGRLYRTGDLARMLPDGSIDYLGRLDHQVKIRGFRIELGEIEAALLGQEGVRSAAVLARQDTPGSPRLVAYVVGEGVPASELRQRLGTTLPDYMVPSAFVFLDAMPLSPSGKLDRRALPAPGAERSEGAAFVAPSTEAERILAEIWETVLGREGVGVEDNFFELGGDSILSLRVVAQAQKRGLDLTLQQLFQLPTIRRLAAAAGRMEATERPVLEPFALVAPEDRAKLPVDLEDAYPLARLQAGMLFHSGYRTGAAAYHQVLSYHLRAPFDAEAFRAALARLVGRHEVLRTSFDLAGFREPLQWVHASAEPRLAVEDLSSLSPAEQEAAVASRVDAETLEPFDESRPPLLRVIVQLRGDGEFQLTMSFHHAILDGWSAASLLTELFQDYLAALRNEALGLGAPAVRFRDLVALEREALASAEARSFWEERLRDLSPSAVPLWPSTGEPGPRMRRLDLALTGAVTEGVREAARMAGAPLKSVLLAAHLKVLGRLAGREDVVTGAVFNTRPEADEGERALGLFLNTLPFRLNTGQGSWTDLVRATFEEEQALLPHRRVPLSELQKRAAGESLFEVMFNFVHFHVYGAVADMAGVEVLGSTFRAETTFLLSVEFGLGLDGASLHLQIDHDASRLPEPEAGWIAGYYQRTLEAMAADPGASHGLWNGLGEAERQQVRFEWNDTFRPYAGPALLHGWIEAQAARTPSAEAVRFEGESLSYAELNLRADGLARHLRSLGVGPDVLVGVCMERSLELVVSLLAVLKAGGAYVPLDPGYPAERLAFMLEDSGTPVLLTQTRLAGMLPAGAIRVDETEWSGEPLDARIDPDGLAYMIYTSGSTGRPKGAMNTHRAIVNRLLWMQEAYGLGAGDRVLQKTPFSFDVSVWEFFWPLMTGATLVVARPEGHRDGAYLVDLIRRERVTTLHFVPSMLRAFLEQPGVEECTSIRQVMCSGEALPHELQERFFSHSKAELHNLYGPTEAAVDVSFWACRRDDERTLVPIGRPIANVRLHVLDGSGSPCPIGVPGELHIGGVALARGYWGRPELTAERFVPDPFSDGGRLYRTGDLARVLPDGSIDYLGRLDHQVKIRGFRIELGEIEAALLGQEGVRSAAVLARQDTPGSPRLVAYVVGERVSASELRQRLGTTLPEYMVPSAFVFLDAMPLSPSGKLDRRALPAPGTERSEDAAYVAPRTEPERVLAAIWETVLGREGIGIEDNFFELGGDSILSLQIVARANQAGFRLTPELMFRHPTVASLASTSVLAPAIQAEQGPVAGPVPLTPIQSWFFEADRAEPQHWNQAVLLTLRRPVATPVLERALATLMEHHDALRLRFVREAGGWRQTGTLPDDTVPLATFDFSTLPKAERSRALERAAGAVQAGLDLENGPVVRAALFHLGDGEPDRLLLAIHHLAVDGVSWRILLEDLWTACEGGTLPPKTTSFQAWAEGLAERARAGAFDAELEHWLEAAGAPVAPLPVDFGSEIPVDGNSVASTRSVAVSLGVEETQALLHEVPKAYQTRIDDVLLTALARAFRGWTREGYLRVDLEGHGREDVLGVLGGADVSRTVGWFTALYPVLLHLSGPGDPGEDLKAVKEELRQIPNRGVGYGLLRYLGNDPGDLAGAAPAEVSFNYLGQLDRVLPEASPFGPAPESAGSLQSPRDRRPWLIEIVASLADGRLGVSWLYSADIHRRDTIERLANAYLNQLRELIEHCRSPQAGGFTPSDFPLADLGQEGLDEFLAALEQG